MPGGCPVQPQHQAKERVKRPALVVRDGKGADGQKAVGADEHVDKARVGGLAQRHTGRYGDQRTRGKGQEAAADRGGALARQGKQQCPLVRYTPFKHRQRRGVLRRHAGGVVRSRKRLVDRDQICMNIMRVADHADIPHIVPHLIAKHGGFAVNMVADGQPEAEQPALDRMLFAVIGDQVPPLRYDGGAEIYPVARAHRQKAAGIKCGARVLFRIADPAVCEILRREPIARKSGAKGYLPDHAAFSFLLIKCSKNTKTGWQYTL